VSFVAVILYVASQRVFIFVSVYFVIDTVRKLLDTPSYISFLLLTLSLSIRSRRRIGGVNITFHACLTSALHVGEWSASCSESFSTHRMGDKVGPGAGLDAVVKRIIPVLAGNQTPVVQPVDARFAYSHSGSFRVSLSFRNL
jgi:hypothetical protein